MQFCIGGQGSLPAPLPIYVACQVYSRRQRSSAPGHYGEKYIPHTLQWESILLQKRCSVPEGLKKLPILLLWSSSSVFLFSICGGGVDGDGIVHGIVDP